MKIRRFLALALSICMMLTVTSLPAMASIGETAEGLGYSIEDGVVTITGDTTGSLTEIVIPATIEGYPVTAISDYAFWKCTSLVSIELPDTITTIGPAAFEYCESLTSIDLPDGLTTMGNSAFYGCESLTSITIPESLTVIPAQAFHSCTKLTSITIPNSVTSIGHLAFVGCTSLANVNYVGTEEQKAELSVGSSNDSLLNATWEFNPAADPISDFEYSISNGVATITKYVGQKSEVVIPAEIEGCPVTKIGYQSFYGCTDLTSVEMPESIKTIELSAFELCTSLTSVTIPANVSYIGTSAFYRCTSLTEFIVDEKNVSYCNDENGVLFLKDKSAIIKYPEGRPNTEYTIPDTVDLIGSSAFNRCTNLKSIIIPDSVKDIGGSAFEDCAITSITIPSSVTIISWYAFYNCKSLTDVYYGGTETDKAAIEISDGNDPLLNATWHYADDVSYISGDVNGDGNINNKDLGLLRQFLNDWDVTIDELAADVNRDGNLNNKDLGILRQYLNNWDVELK